MRVVATVLWCEFVTEDFVVSHVVEVDAVARRASNDRRIYPQIADQRSHCDVNDIIAKTASVPPAREPFFNQSPGPKQRSGLKATPTHSFRNRRRFHTVLDFLRL